MSREISDFVGRPGVTRISVKGGNGWFTVRNGNEPPVRVWSLGGGFRCECGRQDCAHISSLIMCGFVESQECDSKAA
ncbi:MAG TPA: hypothetical protein VLQ48_17515 [Chloroflexia bacterium]|nr:hypothetical protein [Chloroflexia bacterium]